MRISVLQARHVIVLVLAFNVYHAHLVVVQERVDFIIFHTCNSCFWDL